MTKVLKVKTGTAFIDGKNVDVFIDAWEVTSKAGKKYYEIKLPIFVNEVTKKPTEEKVVDV